MPLKYTAPKIRFSRWGDISILQTNSLNPYFNSRQLSKSLSSISKKALTFKRSFDTDVFNRRERVPCPQTTKTQ